MPIDTIALYPPPMVTISLEEYKELMQGAPKEKYSELLNKSAAVSKMLHETEQELKKSHLKAEKYHTAIIDMIHVITNETGLDMMPKIGKTLDILGITCRLRDNPYFQSNRNYIVVIDDCEYGQSENDIKPPNSGKLAE